MATEFKSKAKRKISDLIVDEVKRLIVFEKLNPGDRLPSEKDLIEQYEVSKGTVREAMKALEVEGLIKTKPGPGGGAWLTEVGTEPASRALRNYLYFRHISPKQLYQMRKLIEVELAVSVVGYLSDEDLLLLRKYTDQCNLKPTSEDEQRLQRIAELEFHNVLADASPNPILGFFARFLNESLRDLVVLKKSYLIDYYEFTKSNVDYHYALINAYEKQDIKQVRTLMSEHMCDAETHFIVLDGEISKKM
ncbi:FadR family transcriptional regulator [Marinomonas sp. CT5]|uniref:Regulatory protein GntR HTH n=1 Tax=Marinomonas sp. (strain MWYL1) TaxID=400668 RepID=A6W092_MARMS|nr:GntR family transcriptional regulator [Marinomonas sp. CT5]MBU0801305.1 GntR family transcriptional regulator [Alphaproteobacteria bacterium]QUX96534.1 FadR family transcriptional regulator [Marinomonas sp. CT5]